MRCESALIRLDEMRTGELDRHEVDAVRQHLEHCEYCDGVYRRISGIATSARSLYGECPTSCAESLDRRLFDRVAPATIGGMDLWVAFSERGINDLALPAGRAVLGADSMRAEGVVNGTPRAVLGADSMRAEGVVHTTPRAVLGADSMRAEGVVHTTPAARDLESFVRSHWKRFGKELRRSDLPSTLERQVQDAVAGRGVEQPQVDLSALPDFERRVLETLVSIPNGELRSYSWVAREAGRPKAVRAVGNVCAHNPVPLVVPCHRVVPAAGGLGDYGGGPELKRTLLEREGVDLDRVARLDRAGAKYVKAGDQWYCFPTCRHVRDIPNHELEPVRDEHAAAQLGLIPCDTCRPLVTAA